LTASEAEDYCLYAMHERKKVEEFWGAAWNQPIRINVSSSYRISRALVPGYLVSDRKPHFFGKPPA